MRNNKIIGNIICIIIILATTVGALATYDMLKQGLKSERYSPYETYEFTQFINRNNYILYADSVLNGITDGKNSEEQVTEPIKAFYPKYEDVMKSTYGEDNEKNLSLMYSKDIMQRMNDMLMSWSNNISNPVNIDYVVQDDTDNSIVKQTKIEDKEINLLKGERISTLYDFYIRVQYDNEGNMEIQSVVGADKDAVTNILNSMTSDDYIEGQLESNYDYSYYNRNYDSYDDEGNGYYQIDDVKI